MFFSANKPNGRMKKIRMWLAKSFRIKKYNNLIEAMDVSKFIRKFVGIIVIDLVNTPNGIARKFSIFGFTAFLIWYLIYFFSTFKSYMEDQNILRHMYSTRMQRYGDDCERLFSIIYGMVAMWKIPFSISGNINLMKILIDVDKAVENLGVKIDYNRDAVSASVITIGQIIAYLVRLFSIWLTLKHLEVAIPLERMYQVVYTDELALIVTTHYCYYLTIIRHRFRYTNNLLVEIHTKKSWEYKMFVRGKMSVNVQKAGTFQDKYLSEKIRSCAKIYGMLYREINCINDIFGLVLVMTMLVCFINIILYLFYFLEATAGGLFHDVPKYIDFCIYLAWQIGYALGILYLIVYFCECITTKAKEAAVIVHEIISSDLSPSVTTEAMQLSLQLLHQKPQLTAYGLYKLNYALFEQGARSVSTYLVMLLQFVADANL